MFNKLRRQIRFFKFHVLHLRGVTAIKKWQTGRLRRLIPMIASHIPLYAELLKKSDIRPAEIRTLADLQKLPVTSKAIFLNKPVREYTNRSRSLRGRWAQTSGSSGAPFNPLRRRHVRLPWYGDSLHYRFLFWDKPWVVRAQGMRIAHIRVLPNNKVNHIVVPVTDFLNDTARAVQCIIDFGPHIIESHASILFELATYVHKHGLVLSPRYVVSVSENLSPATRAVVQDALHCPVYNRYGLEEFGTVGVECAQHNGFHVNCESFVVEILDDKGTPCSDGVFGRVIVSDLYNDEMPFVRYDTGDCGKISWTQCACGLYAPRIWIEGRYGAFLTLGGKRYHHFEFDAALDSFMDKIISYQVVKLTETNICVRVLPGPAYHTSDGPDIVKRVQARIGENIAVSVQCVTSIPRVPQGKSQIIKDESASAL